MLVFVYNERDDRLGWVENHIERAAGAGIAPADTIAGEFESLKRDHLVKAPAWGGPVIELTSQGQRRAEALIEKQEKAPEVDVDVEASAVLTIADQRQIEAVLGPIQAALDSGELGLEAPDEQDARALLIVVQSHLKEDRPRLKVVVWALRGLRAIGSSSAQGIAGNAAWAGLIELLHHVH